MINVLRPKASDYFKSRRLTELKDKLWEHNEKSTQQRMHFQIRGLLPIKDELAFAFNHKCAYCESKIGPLNFEIEHYRPKSDTKGTKVYFPQHYFWLAFEWDNLLACCTNCCRSKNNSFPIKNEDNRAKVGDTGELLLREEPLLLNPCDDDPELHLKFDENGEIKPLTERGAVTIKILNLNRTALIDARKNAAINFKQRLRQGFAEKEIKELFSKQATHEYAAVLRIVYRNYADLPIFKETMAFDIETYAKNIKREPVFEIPELNELESFTLKSVEIKNFRTIKHLKLELKPTTSETERESWMLLLGDNGVGKSSILQGIAMTLCGKAQFNALKLNVLDYLRRGTKEGYIRIESYENDKPVELRFTEKGFDVQLKQPICYLMGYGATRLLPKDDLKYKPHKNRYVNILNLFNYSHPLNDVNSWLSNIDKEEFNSRIAQALFDLLDMKDGEQVLIDKKGCLQVQYGNGATDLDKTSDGYKSIVALACDIMKTLSHNMAGYHAVGGIVLIDELGNHLHPRWRMKIAEALRKTFPRLQFIVSSHEPLCLRGLLHGEVVVLAENSKKEIFAIDQKLLPDHNLMKIDQLLTSDLFGLINTFDAETEQRFNEYYRLLSIPENERSTEEKKQIDIYTRLLASKELIGNTPQVQAVYQIVNEKFANNLLKNDFKTQELLKEETIKEVKDMLDLNNLDWL